MISKSLKQLRFFFFFLVRLTIPYKMFPASGIFSARGHDGNQRRHAEEHEKEDDGSLVPDLTSAQDWYQR